MDSPLSVESILASSLSTPSSHSLRHSPSPLSPRPLAYYKCTTTLNSLTPARPARAAGRGRIAHSYDDDGCNCRRSRLSVRVKRRGNPGDSKLPNRRSDRDPTSRGRGRGGGCACDLRHRHGRRIPHLKANPPERDRSMIETATGIQPVIFCFSLSTLSSCQSKRWQSQ